MGAKSNGNSGRPKRSLTLSRAVLRYKLRFSADEDAGETVVRRVERQLNKHCIRSWTSWRRRPGKEKSSKGKAADARVERTELGVKTKLIERNQSGGSPRPLQPSLS